MTQSPQKIYLDLKGFVILEQPERTFALSHSFNNLYIINSDETIIREYVIAKPYEPKRGKMYGLRGKYSNGAWAILVPVDSFDNPQLCQVKICGMTKTYVFEKINRLEGRHALR